ncbi:MAG: GNAT family N-acetyltransferase, partial [Gammaproteobacteria bacterium]|nr:GNAT family N-acetyltransferase [Gammaproteobacteria bacterium]
MPDYTIRSPESDDEWNQYFDLRWQVLRKPWQQPRGSEKDELEENSIHRLAIIDQQVVAVGRLHFISQHEVQIRYMAVTTEFQRQGFGDKILQALEAAALKRKIKVISLNARENAIPFYKKNHYKITGPSHTLYNEIKHVKMKKDLTE